MEENYWRKTTAMKYDTAQSQAICIYLLLVTTPRIRSTTKRKRTTQAVTFITLYWQTYNPLPLTTINAEISALDLITTSQVRLQWYSFFKLNRILGALWMNLTANHWIQWSIINTLNLSYYNIKLLGEIAVRIRNVSKREFFKKNVLSKECSSCSSISR